MGECYLYALNDAYLCYKARGLPVLVFDLYKSAVKKEGKRH